jgi:hypothetical protein
MNKWLILLLVAILWLVALSAYGDYTTEGPIRTKIVDRNEGYVMANPAVTFDKDIAWVLDRIKDAGFSPKVAYDIMQCESGFNKDAVGDGGRSYGLWQINLENPQGKTVHDIGIACATNIECSTEYAIKLMRSTRGLNHWTCYKG